MSDLYWLTDPAWKTRACAECGMQIWPDGDPDWGYCYKCYINRADQINQEENNEQAFLEHACAKAGHPCLYLIGNSSCACKQINYSNGIIDPLI